MDFDEKKRVLAGIHCIGRGVIVRAAWTCHHSLPPLVNLHTHFFETQNVKKWTNKIKTTKQKNSMIRISTSLQYWSYAHTVWPLAVCTSTEWPHDCLKKPQSKLPPVIDMLVFCHWRQICETTLILFATVISANWDKGLNLGLVCPNTGAWAHGTNM